MWGLQQYKFREIQTVAITGNWLDSLDSFIESVTIYNVEGGSCNDVMGYITITNTQWDLFWLSNVKQEITKSCYLCLRRN